MTAVPTSPRSSVAGLLVFGAAVAAVAVVGAIAAGSAGTQYQQLRLPPWAPPSWLFGPVWTALYVLIAVSGWLVWRRRGLGPAMVLYAAQLLLNAAWTPLFFAAREYGLALVDIVVLLVAVVVLTGWFFRLHRVAGALLVPYALWVGYATALNAAIVVLN
ncbi:TspO/MBR family protein [Actinokineospora fastidiosa]|uniref:Tryptophan-rich sensory protein n=1 Tax=Actinokineospora fastidiosa TaxID=1816 RepID=A0A918GQK3_9PSEU|nr:TspO/MBR family protein [Actinokineospora fastidiosa]GGS53436.1 tryptophan-rich sensory protein [Actinokineospora fastidiosa]